MPGAGRMGVLVVRAWLGASPGEEGLRARLISDADGDDGERVEHVAAGIEDILQSVRDWLEGLARSDE